jgi:lipid-binding SYLF domain-containing protein
LPLQAASRHEENVSISLKGMVFVPTLLGVGLILIFKGNKPSEFLGTRESFASSWQAPAFCCMSGLKAGFALMDMNFNART